MADRTGKYWAITLFDYAANLLAVPALALAGSWQAAAALIILERSGKAIRTPARDAMLSHAGRGWGAPDGHLSCTKRWIKPALPSAR